MHWRVYPAGLRGDQSHIMSVTRSSVHAKWIVGKVIGTAMQKTAKVRVTRLVLDPYLLKYFNKRKTYFAHDALQQCTVGDIVLLKALPVPRTKHVKHELAARKSSASFPINKSYLWEFLRLNTVCSEAMTHAASWQSSQIQEHLWREDSQTRVAIESL
uniref:Small ribosomal subunit protein uS17m n=1 Tax=Oryctolagus cuniculus TaxID=9986 RepID=G1TR67_RABIT